MLLRAFPPFFPSPPPPCLILCSCQANPHILDCAPAFSINILWLILSPPFIPPPASFLAAVSMFAVRVSKLLLPLCSLVYCVHQTPHISEIMWYFSFPDWLNSFSMIFSRSIHAVAKCKDFFFLLLLSIPLHKCTTGFLSTHLLRDT